jgi:hypothetical protein
VDFYLQRMDIKDILMMRVGEVSEGKHDRNEMCMPNFDGEISGQETST